jgi:hypothetical protein
MLAIATVTTKPTLTTRRETSVTSIKKRRNINDVRDLIRRLGVAETTPPPTMTDQNESVTETRIGVGIRKTRKGGRGHGRLHRDAKIETILPDTTETGTKTGTSERQIGLELVRVRRSVPTDSRAGTRSRGRRIGIGNRRRRKNSTTLRERSA